MPVVTASGGVGATGLFAFGRVRAVRVLASRGHGLRVPLKVICGVGLFSSSAKVLLQYEV